MRRLSFFFLLLAALVSVSWFFWDNATLDPSPFRVAPYLQFGTDSSMVVMWETDQPATTQVYYGESRYGDEQPNLTQTMTLDGQRTMHEVPLIGLQPATKYFWRAVSTTADGDTLQSEPSTFRTTVGTSSAFAFVLYGDSQNNPEVWGKVAQLGWQERPNFALLAGDLVDRGGNLDDWLVDFFPPANVLMRRVPLYTALGNHEDDHANYYKYMHNPPPEYFYTFSYGNAQFFIVDTNRDVSEGSEQYEWLEDELAQSTATWKFVMHHHPPYSSEENDHGNSWTGSTTYGTNARNLVALYEAYGVDFCLFGHVHMYERTWPIFEGQLNQQNGVIYINSGGAGGGLEDFAPTRSWFSAKVKSTHHFTYFAVHDDHLFFQAIDENGVLFDSFELKKDAARIARARVVKPPAPKLAPRSTLFTDDVTVTLSTTLEDLTVHYTLDGSEPTPASPRYTTPIRVSQTATLKAIAVTADGRTSRIRTEHYTQATPQPAQNRSGARPGLVAHYYEGRWHALPDFAQLAPKHTTTTTTISLDPAEREDEIGLVFEGYVKVPETGVYTFYTASDDGSQLFINGEVVVDNDGLHGTQTEAGQVALEAGLHALRVTFFERTGGESLTVSWAGPGFEKQHLRGTALFHLP